MVQDVIPENNQKLPSKPIPSSVEIKVGANFISMNKNKMLNVVTMLDPMLLAFEGNSSDKNMKQTGTYPPKYPA